MYAIRREEECQEYAIQSAGAIFRTRLRKSCRIPMYLPIRQSFTKSQRLRLSEYRANLVKKEGEPSWYSPPSTQFTRLLRVHCKGSHYFRFCNRCASAIAISSSTTSPGVMHPALAVSLIHSLDASLIRQLTRTGLRGERLRPAPGLAPPLAISALFYSRRIRPPQLVADISAYQFNLTAFNAESGFCSKLANLLFILR